MYRTISPPEKEPARLSQSGGPARLIRSGGEWIQVRNETEDELVENMIAIFKNHPGLKQRFFFNYSTVVQATPP